MCNIKKIVFFLFIVMVFPALSVNAQNTQSKTATDDAYEFPQWAKDLRRWEIVAFGSFPFTMFMSTFAMDMHRWNTANKMDFSDAGRRYAPWPLKSAGAVTMSNKEYETTMIIAASLSAVVAITDLIIIHVKRNKARQRAESLPASSTVINKQPWPIVPQQEDTADNAEAGVKSGDAAQAENGAALSPVIPEP